MRRLNSRRRTKPTSHAARRNNVEHAKFLERVGLTDHYRPKNDHAVLQCLAVVVALGGIVQDSPAVVIGAMLLAPLMMPVLSLSASIALGKTTDAARIAGWVTALVIGSIGLSAFLGWLLPSVPLTDELLNRTSPDLRDLAIALAAGSAGAYGLTRADRGSALPGVAVAVALVPPMAATGLALAADRPELAQGAALLVATNLAAIIVMGIITFVATGTVSTAIVRQHARSVISSLGLFAVLLGLVTVPLGLRSIETFEQSRQRSDLEVAIRDWLGPSATRITDVDISDDRIVISLAGPSPPPSPVSLESSAVATLGRRVTVDLRWVQEVAGERGETAAERTLTPATINQLVEMWLFDAQLGPGTPRIEEVIINGGDLELSLVGELPPPDTGPLLDALEETRGMRPQITIEWQQSSGETVTEVTVDDIERTVRRHFADVMPGIIVVSAWLTGDEFTALVVGVPDDDATVGAAEAIRALDDALELKIVSLGDLAGLRQVDEAASPTLLADPLDVVEPRIERILAAVALFNNGDLSELSLLLDDSDGEELSQVIAAHVIFDRPPNDGELSFILLQERSGGSLRPRRVVMTLTDRVSIQPLEPQAIDVRDPEAVVDALFDAASTVVDEAATSLIHPSNQNAPATADVGARTLDYGTTGFELIDADRQALVPVLVSVAGSDAPMVRCELYRLRTFGLTDAWLVNSVERDDPVPIRSGATRYGHYCPVG